MKSLERIDEHHPTGKGAAAAPPPLEPQPVVPDDRRQEGVRYPVHNLRSRFGSGPNAEVINLSLGGFAVKTSKYLEIRRVYSIRLEGPSEHDLTAEVAWCRMVGTQRTVGGQIEPLFHAGLQFLELSEEDRWKLRGLIRQTSDQPSCTIDDAIQPQGG